MRIGIISGAGAYTGAVFYKKLIDKISKLNFISKDEDFPYIKLINYPFKSISNKGLEDNLILEKELYHCLDKMSYCDKTEALINSAKDSNIYWQFIGVTKHNSELKQIEQWGEKYSNVGFFKFSDLYSMDENKLYENLVSSEFISFIKKENA